MSLVQSFATDNGGGKVAINLGRVTSAVPVGRYKPGSSTDIERCAAVTVEGAAQPFVLKISYEDFVFAWNQAITPPPPVQIRSAR